MKKRIIMIATLVVAIYNMVLAADKVTINDFKIVAGETKVVSITLDNDAAYVAFQFDLYLPEGITIESYSANSARVPKSTTLSMSTLADGSYRFIASAINAEPLTGTSGSIVMLTVKASEELSPGEKTGYFRKVKLALANATGKKYEEMSFPITVLDTLRGDVNGDGEVNITDVTYIIDKINDRPAADFDEKAADLNEDGEINITDVTLLLDIINKAK